MSKEKHYQKLCSELSGQMRVLKITTSLIEKTYSSGLPLPKFYLLRGALEYNSTVFWEFPNVAFDVRIAYDSATIRGVEIRYPSTMEVDIAAEQVLAQLKKTIEFFTNQ
jgi:hypothetical protein